MPVPLTLDCQRCGACCIAERDEETYVDLVPADIRRLRASGRISLVVLDANGHTGSLATRRDAAGNVVCAALSGNPGQAVACRIYRHRPGLCRTFEPGSVACLHARHTLGVTPLHA